MNRVSITTKIWLSIGVFVLGFVLATALGQIQGRNTENTLRTTSDTLFPAAQRSQEAEAAFERMVKGFSDAVVVQDTSGLDRAAEDGRTLAASLKAIAAVPGLSNIRVEEAARLDHRSLNIDTFNLIYVLMGHALPEEAQSRPVQRAGNAQAGFHPEVSNRRETAHPSGGDSFGFAIWTE
jgi:hypothetical protein